MSNYTKTTNFAIKDALISGDVNKIVKGTEIDLEFTNIQAAVLTKADISGPTLTGTTTVAALTATGVVSVIDSNLNIKGSVDATKILKLEADTNIATATTVTLTSPSASGVIGTTVDATGRVFQNDYISGFALTTASATTYDIAAGYAADSTNAVALQGAAITAKSQNSWVAGSAQGGKLHVAGMANNTWYYWFALWKTADATVDYGFDVATTPTFPTGYSKFRYIGARKTQLASTNWETFIQHGDEILWSTPPALDLNAAPSTANRTLTTMNVPAVRVRWFGNGYCIISNSNIGILLTDPTTTDVAAGAGALTPLSSFAAFSNNATNSFGGGSQVSCWTNTSSQIGVRGSTANAVQIQTLGWIDPRGKPV